MPQNRAKREYHKHKLISLDNSLKVLLPKYAPRLTPLGTDADDRVYWILSPGVSEREAAQEFIHSCSSDEKHMQGRRSNKRNVVKKAKVLAGEEERAEMRSWSWFVAVWGRKPEDAAGASGSKAVKAKEKEREAVKLKIKVRPKAKMEMNAQSKTKRRSLSGEDMDVDDESRSQDDDEDRGDDDEDEEMGSASDHSSASGPVSDEEDDSSDNDSENEAESSDKETNNQKVEDEDKERWWGFYDPLEIFKLSDWIAIKAGLDDDSGNPANTNTTSTLAPNSVKDRDRDDQDSCVSSSTTTLNGTGTTTPTVNGNGAHTNGNMGKKSRDTSVTVVADSTDSSSVPSRPLPVNSHKSQLKNLVDELRTFAGLLEWRCREDKYEVVLRDLSAAAGGASVSANDGGKGKERESTGGSVSASSFYGTR